MNQCPVCKRQIRSSGYFEVYHAADGTPICEIIQPNNDRRITTVGKHSPASNPKSSPSPSLSTEAARELSRRIRSLYQNASNTPIGELECTTASIILPYLAGRESERRVWDRAIAIVLNAAEGYKGEFRPDGSSFSVMKREVCFAILRQMQEAKSRDRGASPAPVCTCLAPPTEQHATYCPREGMDYDAPDEVGGGVEGDCQDCRKAAAHAYSDATTPGFFYTKCEKHRVP